MRLPSLTGPLTLLESNAHRKLISRVLGVFVVVGVRSEPRPFSGWIGPISRIGPIGVLLVERVMLTIKAGTYRDLSKSRGRRPYSS